MNAKDMKTLILDIDFKDLFDKVDLYSNRDKIVQNFCNLIGCKEEYVLFYFDDFNKVKAEPNKFRQACIQYINQLIEQTNYPELQQFARILA